MFPLMRPAAASLVSFSLAIANVSAPAFAEPISRAEYEACQARDVESFRSAIEGITVRALQKGIAGLDYKAVVAEEWRRGKLDEIIDARIDLAVDEVRSETSWASLLQSLADAKKSQELATAVAERVYRSDTVTAAIENLAVGVGREVGKRLEIASVDAAEPALGCLQAFIGKRYGAAVARIVAADAGKEFGLEAVPGGADVTAGAVLRQSGAGLTGAAVLLVRRQLANMASRVGQRLVGSVLSRLVSVVAGGIGLALIAKDLWDLRHGVLPIIAEEMKSPATKDKVQDELARTISEQIGEHVKEIGANAAAHIIDIWQDFRLAHAKALELAESNDRFKDFLNGLKPEALPRLDEVVALVLPAEGVGGVLKRLTDGTLNEAINVMPAPAMDIARETRSIDAALKWSAVASGDLGKVVELELHRRASPENFTKASLQRILGLDDRLAITRLASLERTQRDALFDLTDKELLSLGRSLTEGELATLARYLAGLQKDARERVLRTVAASPGKMQVLASARIREAIIASHDQLAAVAMMLRTSTLVDPALALDDFRLAWDGRVSPILVWEKHPGLVGGLAVIGMLTLLFLRRLLLPRRRHDAAAPTA